MTEHSGRSGTDYSNARPATVSLPLGDLAFHGRGFDLSLAAANKSPNKIKSYLEAVAQLDPFLAAHGMPLDVANIRGSMSSPSSSTS
jgi:hypothetical protein